MVTPSINNFLSNLAARGGEAKSERFHVQITPPIAITNSTTVAYNLQFQCELAEIPGVAVETTKYRLYGIEKNIAIGKRYDEIVLSFICTNSFYEKPFFDSWVDYISPEQGGWDLNYKDVYSGSLIIFQQDQAGNIIYYATLISTFPVHVAGMPTRWSDDSIHKLNVTFIYDKYASNVTTPIGGIPFIPDTTILNGNLNPFIG